MSTSMYSPPRQPVNLERTRQQLQELDALLQQMLELPIADGEANEPTEAHGMPTPVATERAGSAFVAILDQANPSIASVPTDRGMSHQRDVQAAPQLLVFPMPEPQAELAESGQNIASSETNELVEPEPVHRPPLEATFGSRALPGSRLCDQVQVAPVVEKDVPVAEPPSQPKSVENVRVQFPEPHHPPHVEPARGLSWLVGINDAFDATVGRMGSLGDAATGPTGRTLLGWFGIIALVAAVALAMGWWLGWNW